MSLTDYVILRPWSRIAASSSIMAGPPWTRAASTGDAERVPRRLSQALSAGFKARRALAAWRQPGVGGYATPREIDDEEYDG